MTALGDPTRHFFATTTRTGPEDRGACHFCRRPESAHPQRPADPVEALRFFGGTIGGYPT